MIDWTTILTVFFLVFLVLFLPSILRVFAHRSRKVEKPLEYQQEEEQRLPPPLPIIYQHPPKTTERVVTPEFEFHDHLETLQSENPIEERHLESHIHPEFKKEVASEAFIVKKQRERKSKKHPRFERLESMSSLSKMVIYPEVIERPWE